jgi:hypothetical protein
MRRKFHGRTESGSCWLTPALCLLLSGCGGGGGGTATNRAGYAATPLVLPSEERILPPSLELERRTQPWCPGDCDVAVPFVASYQHGAERLVFVGVRHAFQSNDPTMLAVAAGFSEIHPGIVIVEGFPTAMGENPAPLVAEARRYGAPDASEFDRGEAMYAASLALEKGIPFLGGEPSQEEEMQVLKAKGFTDSDISFDARCIRSWQRRSRRRLIWGVGTWPLPPWTIFESATGTNMESIMP